jgi:hypothetical protein
MPRRAYGSGFFTTGTRGSGDGVRGIRVWARLLGLRRVVVEDVRIGGEGEVVVCVRLASRTGIAAVYAGADRRVWISARAVGGGARLTSARRSRLWRPSRHG